MTLCYKISLACFAGEEPHTCKYFDEFEDVVSREANPAVDVTIDEPSAGPSSSQHERTRDNSSPSNNPWVVPKNTSTRAWKLLQCLGIIKKGKECASLHYNMHLLGSWVTYTLIAEACHTTMQIKWCQFIQVSFLGGHLYLFSLAIKTT